MTDYTMTEYEITITVQAEDDEKANEIADGIVLPPGVDAIDIQVREVLP